MKKEIYQLNSCSTCARISKELGVDASWHNQNIKEQNISEEILDAAKEQLGSYEALFSKRAMKYKSLGLKDKIKTDQEYKNYILEEYTFLKRPLVKINDTFFAGNSKKTVAEIQEALANG